MTTATPKSTNYESRSIKKRLYNPDFDKLQPNFCNAHDAKLVIYNIAVGITPSQKTQWFSARTALLYSDSERPNPIIGDAGIRMYLREIGEELENEKKERG